MSLTMQITPQVTTVQMPASGTLMTVPARGDIVPFSFLPLEPDTQGDQRPPEQIDAKKECHYQLARVDPAIARIVEEIDSASARIERFVGDGGVFSKQALHNPLVPVNRPSVYDVRNDQIRAQLLSLLWDDTMLELVGGIAADNAIVSIESRLEAKLSASHVAFAAALMGIGVDDALRIGTRALGERLRWEQGIVTPSVANPSALFERVRINDPVLYGQHVVSAPIDDVQSYLENYWREAERYWNRVKTTGLYSHEDMAFLTALGLVDAGPETSPFPLVVAKKTKATEASEIAHVERTAWFAKIDRYNDDVKILTAICNQVTDYFMLGWPAEVQNMTREERGDWLAKRIVAELGFGPEKAPGHALDAQRLLSLFSGFFDLEIAELDKIVEYAGGKKEYVPPKIKAILSTPNIWRNVNGVVINQLIATQWEIRVPGVLGNLTVRPPYVAFDDAPKPGMEDGVEFGVPGDGLDKPVKLDATTTVDFVAAAGILYNLYLDPYRYDLYLSDLTRWRQELESDLSRTSKREPSQRFAAMARFFFQQFEEFRVALAAANRSNDLRTAIFSINERLGYQDVYFHNRGRVVLPHDSIVTAVYVAVGEYVEERRPIFSLEHRYRRNADFTMDPASALAADLAVGGVYLVTGDSLPVEGVAWTLVVKTVRVTDAGSMAFSAEIFPVIDVSAIAEGVQNVPQYLPLSDRYCVSDYKLVAAEIGEKASAALPRMGSLQVGIERRLY